MEQPWQRILVERESAVIAAAVERWSRSVAEQAKMRVAANVASALEQVRARLRSS